MFWVKIVKFGGIIFKTNDFIIRKISEIITNKLYYIKY